MSHRDYIMQRDRREPQFAAERQAAAAELAVGEAVVRRREERGITIAELSDRTGGPEARLEAIEEGESMTLHEVLWLLHALDLTLALGPDFHVAAQESVRPTDLFPASTSTGKTRRDAVAPRQLTSSH